MAFYKCKKLLQKRKCNIYATVTYMLHLKKQMQKIYRVVKSKVILFQQLFVFRKFYTKIGY